MAAHRNDLLAAATEVQREIQMKLSKSALGACASLVLGAESGTMAQTPRTTTARQMTARVRSAARLPSERTIGRIEAVFEFHDAMPTGRHGRLRWAHLHQLPPLGR